MKPFQIGNKVEIVNYGHLFWINNRELEDRGYKKKKPYRTDKATNTSWFDNQPQLVGRIGTITGISNTQTGSWIYRLDDIPEKVAWYDHEQLKLVE